MYETEVLSLSSERFVIFALGALLFKPFLAKCRSLYKTIFLARDDHVFSFLNWAHHFLALFSKAHEFVQNSAFSLRSARFVIFAVGHTTLLCFQQSARRLRKQKFSAQDQNVLSFSHWAHYFLAIFSKVHECEQNSLYSPRSGRFVIFALGAPRFSDFQQSARVCAKQHFQPEISMFCHFRTGRTTFLRLSTKCTSLYKTAFSAQDQHVLLIFALGVPLFTLLSKAHQFVQSSVFSRRSERFVIFVLGLLLFSHF